MRRISIILLKCIYFSLSVETTHETVKTALNSEGCLGIRGISRF